MWPRAATALAVAALVLVLVSSSEGAVTTEPPPLKEVFREMRQLAEVSGQHSSVKS